MFDVIVQIIGFLGLLAFILSYQTKTNRSLYLAQTTGALLFVIQFSLLGAISGCFSLVLIALRDILLSKYKEWIWVRNKICPVVFCILFTAVLWFTWAGPISLLAYIASIVSTIFYWTNNARSLRVANLFICSPCWIIYDVLVGSWGGILNEALAIASIVISIARFGWKNLGTKDL